MFQYQGVNVKKFSLVVVFLFNITFFLSIFPHPTSCIDCSGMMMQLCCFENKWEVWKNSEIDLKLKNNICTFFGSDLGEDNACHLLALVLSIRGSFYQSVNNHDLNRPCTKDFLTISQWRKQYGWWKKVNICNPYGYEWDDFMNILESVDWGVEARKGFIGII